MGLMALWLQQPGLLVLSCLDLIDIPSHRAAFASFLSADWFLAKYAKNYFAKSLTLRTPAHEIVAQDAGAEPGNVCMACWHFRRIAALEDEFHALCVCP